LPEISYHLLILIAGFAVAVLAFVIALAVGPYGRRGVRFTFGSIALTAFVGSVAWLVAYFGMIQQRRAIEERIAALRTQAMTSGTLACLERAGATVQESCAQSLFASPGVISSAGVYVGSRLDVMKAARRYSGPRTVQFDDAVAALGRSLQEDPFGLTADILMRREGCTGERCEALSLFADPARLAENIRNKTFDANVARYTAGWGTPQAVAPSAAPMPTITPGGETRAPIPDKYQLPSAASIPPVSIMTDEPPQRAAPAPAAKDRPAAPPQEAAAPAAETATPPEQAETPPAAQKKSPPRRPKQQQNAPLSIAPQR
jgi:hypothetical protein